MASSNKTSNLQLNQWVLSDPVLMEDFNADNMKIEAAILESVEKLEELRRSGVVERLTEAEIKQSDVKNVEIDLSGIDFTKYQQLRLCRVTDAASVTFYLRVNNLSSNYQFRSGTSNWSAYGSHTFISRCFADFYIADSKSDVRWGDLDILYYSSVKVTSQTLNSINLMMNSEGTTNFPVGDRFTLLGVKK